MPEPATRPTPARPRRVRLGLAAWAALALLQILWYGWLLPPEATTRWAALALALLPLALPLLALRRPARALLWAAIVGIFYFAHGVTELWALPAARPLAAVEVVLALGVILAAGAARPGRRGRGGPAKLR